MSALIMARTLLPLAARPVRWLRRISSDENPREISSSELAGRACMPLGKGQTKWCSSDMENGCLKFCKKSFRIFQCCLHRHAHFSRMGESFFFFNGNVRGKNDHIRRVDFTLAEF